MTAPTPSARAELQVLAECGCAAEQSIRKFTAALDAGDADEMCRWFAPDAVWIRPSGTIEGHRGVREFVAEIASTTTMRHVVTNTCTDSDLPGQISASSYFTVYLHDSVETSAQSALVPVAVGRYLDRLELRNERWVIVEREVRFDIR